MNLAKFHQYHAPMRRGLFGGARGHPSSPTLSPLFPWILSGVTILSIARTLQLSCQVELSGKEQDAVLSRAEAEAATFI